MLAALERNGRSLRNLDETSRGNRKLVLAAVRQNGHALQYATPDLRNDAEVVRAAVGNRATAIYYASEQLQDDQSLRCVAVQQNKLLANVDIKKLRSDTNIVLSDLFSRMGLH